MRAQENHYKVQLDEQRRQMEVILCKVVNGQANPSTVPNFAAFDSTAELWADYWKRFLTFVEANSIPEGKKVHVFLTNQSPVMYKLLTNLAAQQTPAKDVNQLTIEEIADHMKEQFDPKRFVVRERFKFWSQMSRKPGETIQELVARIRHDAVTCDFSAITDPLDEAMRTRFICSVKNEAVLKALLKVKDSELTFNRAIEIAIETEDAAKVAKETVYGQSPSQGVNAIRTKGKSVPVKGTDIRCYCCNRAGHVAKECRFKDATCNICKEKGHISQACSGQKGRHQGKQMKQRKSPVKTIKLVQSDTVLKVEKLPVLQQPVIIKGQTIDFEVDTGAGENFMGKSVWQKLGAPTIEEPVRQFQSASQHPLPVLGTLTVQAALP
jgi:hypothetical protein